jgi:hypothetical protein
MPRLQYSANGMLRAIEMSRAAVVALVEGFIDRSFYSEVLANSTDTRDKTIEVRLAHEIHASLGSGKKALLSFHHKLRSAGKLIQGNATNGKVILIFLDKDIDDIKRSLKKCPHTIYTEHYSVENYLYLHGDLPTALVNGAYLDRQSVSTFPNNTLWTTQSATSWSNWIAFCLLSAKSSSMNLPNFGVKSLINTNTFGPCERARLTALLTSGSRRSGINISDISKLYRREEKRVSTMIRSNTFNKVFNGKWYHGFFAEEARRVAAGRALPADFEDRLESTLLSTLDFSGGWLAHLRTRIASVISRLPTIEGVNPG